MVGRGLHWCGATPTDRTVQMVCLYPTSVFLFCFIHPFRPHPLFVLFYCWRYPSPSASAFVENNRLWAPGMRGSYTLGEQLTLIPHLPCPPVPALGTCALFPHPCPFPLALLFDSEPPPPPPRTPTSPPFLLRATMRILPLVYSARIKTERRWASVPAAIRTDGSAAANLSHLLQSGWSREREVTDFRQGLYTPLHPPLFSDIPVKSTQRRPYANE